MRASQTGKVWTELFLTIALGRFGPSRECGVSGTNRGQFVCIHGYPDRPSTHNLSNGAKVAHLVTISQIWKSLLLRELRGGATVALLGQRNYTCMTWHHVTPPAPTPISRLTRHTHTRKQAHGPHFMIAAVRCVLLLFSLRSRLLARPPVAALAAARLLRPHGARPLADIELPHAAPRP